MKGEQLLNDENGSPVYRVTWEAHSHVVDFKAYFVNSFTVDPVVIVDEDLICESFIKWDACSNWKFYTDSWVHFCGIDGLLKFHSMQVWLYAKAADLMAQKGECGIDVEEFVPTVYAEKPAS